MLCSAQSLSACADLWLSCLVGTWARCLGCLDCSLTTTSILTRMPQLPCLPAAWGGSLDVVETLLGAGVDPRASDREGRSSLHAAAWGGNDRVRGSEAQRT